jgi:5-amino-6-(5-phosphoribosylamino)uracil reductase
LGGRLGETEAVWRRKFEAFVDRKTGQALSTPLPRYLTELDSHPPEARAIGNPWTRTLFDGDFYLLPSPDPRRPACHLVFVQSRDGNTVARDPSRLGGGETDKHLIYEGLSRVAADGVLSGAETIRGGHIIMSVWHPELVGLRESLGKPRHPTQIVATLQGVDLAGGLLFNVPSIPVLLLTIGPTATLMQNALADRPWIKAVVMPRPSDLGDAFEQLQSLGIARLSCTGGRRIATQLIDAGLIQDVHLTTSPRSGGEPNTPLYPKPLDARVVVRKRGTGDEAGVTFEHMSLT